MNPKLTLAVQPLQYAVCRMPAESPIPEWALRGEFFCVARTADELSIVCLESEVPADIQRECDWRCFKIVGPLAFALSGVLAAVLRPLAEMGVSIFAISTFDTDYILVKHEKLELACQVLHSAGHQVNKC